MKFTGTHDLTVPDSQPRWFGLRQLKFARYRMHYETNEHYLLIITIFTIIFIVQFVTRASDSYKETRPSPHSTSRRIIMK